MNRITPCVVTRTELSTTRTALRAPTKIYRIPIRVSTKFTRTAIWYDASCQQRLGHAWAPIERSKVQPRMTRMGEKLHSRKTHIQLFQSIDAALPPAYDEHSHSCDSCDSWFTLPRPPGSQCNQPLRQRGQAYFYSFAQQRGLTPSPFPRARAQ